MAGFIGERHPKKYGRITAPIVAECVAPLHDTGSGLGQNGVESLLQFRK